MTLFMREQLQRIFMETGTTTVLVSHDLEEAVYLADRVLLLSRHPAADRRLRTLRNAAPPHGRDAVASRLRDHQGALPRNLPARGVPRMEKITSISAGARRVGADRPLVRGGVGAGGRSGAAAAADRHLPRHVDRHDQGQARQRLHAYGGAHRLRHRHCRGDRHPARHFPRRIGAALSSVWSS